MAPETFAEPDDDPAFLACEEASTHLVHRTTPEHSARNLQRRVADFSRSAVIVWYSSHSVANRRGSVMAYTVRSRHVGAWYAAFSYDVGWRLGRVGDQQARD